MLIYLLLFGLELVTIPIYLYKKGLYLTINVIPLWILMAYRNFNVGVDTPTYMNFFYQNGMYNVGSAVRNWFFPYHTRFENGFVVLNHLVYKINPNFQLMLIVTATIMIGCFIFFMVKLRINYVIGLCIYEATFFMTSCMNLMRQGLAMSLCMVAMVYAIKRKPFKFILFTYLASLMHVTAWLFLPVYFLRKVKLNKNGIIGTMIIAGVLSSSFEFIYSKLSNASDEVQSFSNSIANNNSSGLLNIIFSVVWIVIVLWASGKINVNNNLLITYGQLMLLVALVPYILAIRFSQLSRIAMYFTIGLFPILSSMVGGYSFKKNKVIIAGIIIAALIIYFVVVQLYRPGWFGIVPYSFFNN